MVAPGHFRLHDRAEPRVGAGDYRLLGRQTVTGGVTEEHVAHVRVTSPRYVLPPDQILSTWPAANEEGAFESRLPQVVLRRRTLPWERVVDPDRAVPWLALVVIAEGEGALSAQAPVADCVTPGVHLTGPSDVAAGTYLSVTATVVDKVFPTKEDLALLTHVREVDVSDTELVMGDDDGFLAVVLANRLPQFDRVTCAPVRYMACLVNLEGQLHELPEPQEPRRHFAVDEVVQDLRPVFEEYSQVPDHRFTGTGAYESPGPLLTQPGAGGGAPAEQPRPPAGPAAARFAGPAGARTFRAAAQEPVAVTDARSTWQTAPAAIQDAAVAASNSEVARIVRDSMRLGFHLPVELLVSERVLRFPVLAHWSFTCTGAGSFESLMQGLDVGLLGTVPADPAARPRPVCSDEPAGDAPPGAPGARPAPELAETGHLGLAHQTRRGEQARAWYRGPLSPHVTTRLEAGEDGRLPLAHVSDQLRRVTPDGREDLTYAAAFEIGRLLALSQPAVVGALMRWRREQFGAARAARLAERGVRQLLEDVRDVRVADLGRLLGLSYLTDVAKDPGGTLGPSRPLVDPGRPLDHVDGDVVQVLAEGFSLEHDLVKEALSRGTRFAEADVRVFGTDEVFDGRTVAGLAEHLTGEVEALVTGGRFERRPGRDPRGPGDHRPPDDDLRPPDDDVRRPPRDDLRPPDDVRRPPRRGRPGRPQEDRVQEDRVQEDRVQEEQGAAPRDALDEVIAAAARRRAEEVDR